MVQDQLEPERNRIAIERYPDGGRRFIEKSGGLQSRLLLLQGTRAFS